MRLSQHIIRSLRAELVARFRFDSDPRSWLIVARVSERSVPRQPRGVIWLESRPLRLKRVRPKRPVPVPRPA